MVAPASCAASMFFKWICESGISRVTRMHRRCSFKHTSAVRVIRLSALPDAIAESVFALQGMITIPSWRWDPLAISAPIALIS